MYHQIPQLQLLNVGKFQTDWYGSSHVGVQLNAHEPTFPSNIIENLPTSLACNSTINSDDLKIDWEANYTTLHVVQKILEILLLTYMIMILMTSYEKLQLIY